MSTPGGHGGRCFPALLLRLKALKSKEGSVSLLALLLPSPRGSAAFDFAIARLSRRVSLVPFPATPPASLYPVPVSPLPPHFLPTTPTLSSHAAIAFPSPERFQIVLRLLPVPSCSPTVSPFHSSRFARRAQEGVGLFQRDSAPPLPKWVFPPSPAVSPFLDDRMTGDLGGFGLPSPRAPLLQVCRLPNPRRFSGISMPSRTPVSL